jgi:hypothetical protein
MAAVAVLLAAPVSAQGLVLNVNVPFEFSVGGHILPPGDYVVSRINDPGLLRVRNVSSGAMPTAVTPSLGGGQVVAGEASLTFHRYGSDYFLAKISVGYTDQGRSIPMSRTEQERAKKASLSKPEVVMVLARR